MKDAPLVKKLVARAFQSTETLGTHELIDLNLAAALILVKYDEQESARCAYTASLLEKAEANQTEFLKEISLS